MSDEAASEDPDKATFELAEALFARGDFRAAARLWAGLTGDGDALFNAANAYMEAGHHKKARPLYRKAIRMGITEAYLNYSYALHAAGQRNDARRQRGFADRVEDPNGMLAHAVDILDLDPPRVVARMRQLSERDDDVGRIARLITAQARRLINPNDPRIEDVLSAATDDPESQIEFADWLASVGRPSESEAILTALVADGHGTSEPPRH